MTPPAYRSGISVRQQPRDPFVRAVPMVRIRLPPAGSQLRTLLPRAPSLTATGCAKNRRDPPNAALGGRGDQHSDFDAALLVPCAASAQPELGEDEAGAEPEHRPKSQKYCCRDGHCFARLSRLTTEDGRCYDTAQCGSHKV